MLCGRDCTSCFLYRVAWSYFELWVGQSTAMGVNQNWRWAAEWEASVVE